MVMVNNKHSVSNKLQLFITGLFILLSFNAQALTKVTASVDKNPVSLDSSFLLSIEADGSIDASDWDNSVLLSHFIVGRTSVNSQTSYINGRRSQSTKFTTLLMAKEAGEFTIPEFTIKGLKTNPITLTVVNLPAGSATGAQGNSLSTQQNTPQKALQNKNVDLQVSVDSNEVYVGQQFIYTSKLLLAENTEMRSGSLTAPNLPKGTIKQIGKDENGSEIINGRRFKTITRQYAITLDQPGAFMIAPSRFEGQLMTTDNYYRFSAPRPTIVQGEKLPITIKAKPKNYQGDWLASDFVQLTEELQPQQKSYTIGEPITRTITLTVANTDKASLPELQINWPENVKVYPDKPLLNEFAQQGHYFSQLVLSYAIVPNQAGKVELPEVHLPWFNTKTQQQEWAKLPAHTLKVMQGQQPVIAPPVISRSTPKETTSGPIWIWLTCIFAGLWLLTCSLWFLQYRYGKTKVSAKSEPEHSPQPQQKSSPVWPQLQQALKANNAPQAEKLLQQWFRACWPEREHYNIDDLPLSDETKLACKLLSKTVYGREDVQWQGVALLNALQQEKSVDISAKDRKNNKDADLILQLNP